MFRKIVYSVIWRRAAFGLAFTLAGTLFASGHEVSAESASDSVASQQLREVTVTAQGARQRIADTRLGAEHLELSRLAQVPMLFGENDIIFFRVFIIPNSRRYVEGLKDYVIVHLEGRRVVTRIKIKDLTDLLPAGMFLRVSRSYVVNRRFVEAFDNRDVVVAGTEIAIGATYREAVLASLLG